MTASANPRLTLGVASDVVVRPSSSWTTEHPTNPSFAFAGLIQDDGAVTLAFDDVGNGAVVGQVRLYAHLPGAPSPFISPSLRPCVPLQAIKFGAATKRFCDVP